MLVNRSSLLDLFTALDGAFQGGLGLAAPDWQRVAMPVRTSAIAQKHPWLKDIPGMRRWIGDRQVNALAASSYEIENLEYEGTIEVRTRDLESDQFGIFTTQARLMGEAFAAFPNQQVFAALLAGFSTLCYDGQSFFDTDHPVIAADGTATTASNSGGGSGTPWFLLCTGRAVKPLIWQVRKEEPFKQLTPQELIDRDKRVEYGAYADCAVGFGFWQLAYGSKQTLDATAYAAARTAVSSFKGDYGRPLGLVPDLLVVPPSLEGAARKIVANSLTTGGETNEWAGTAQVLMTPWLA